jgi:hypothetical protein
MAEIPRLELFATADALRLREAREQGMRWRQSGPYLSERQWGTVREDYSNDLLVARHLVAVSNFILATLKCTLS